MPSFTFARFFQEIPELPTYNHLCCAAIEGDLQQIKTYIEVDHIPILPAPESLTENQTTALYGAAREGRLEIVKYLYEKNGQTESATNIIDIGGISPDGTLSPNTPLHIAIAKEHFDVAAYLIQQGANVNAVNTVGQTPIELALFTARTNFIFTQAMVPLLIQHGAQYDGAQLYLHAERMLGIIQHLSESEKTARLKDLKRILMPKKSRKGRQKDLFESLVLHEKHLNESYMVYQQPHTSPEAPTEEEDDFVKISEMLDVLSETDEPDFSRQPGLTR